MFEQISTGRGPMYDQGAVQPMRDELIFVGFEELHTTEEVDAAVLNGGGTTLVVVNSVCGCAAGSARPGATRALQHAVIPDRFVTVFAGQERDATDRMRSYFKNIPPSSPSMAILKDGQLVFMLQRHDIEGRSAEEVSGMLTAAFDEFCTRTGPSIPAEKYSELEHASTCGSRIPRLN